MRSLLTTSWDDGHPLDLRLANLLAKHGLRGTFYVPAECEGREVIGANSIRELAALGMELGAHTLTHKVLTSLPHSQALAEIDGGKKYLEDILGQAVTAFCYPRGKFDSRTRASVAAAGFAAARTTLAFSNAPAFDPLLMPVSFQFFSHRPLTLLRHALAEGNWNGVWNWITRWRLSSGLETLSARAAALAASAPGLIHIWGHSWEVESAGLWPLLEAIVQMLSQLPAIQFVTNSQAVAK